MKWVSVKDALPIDGQAVLVRYVQDNWVKAHTLENGEARKHWRWQAMWFVKGRTAAEVTEAGYVRQEDEAGNNLRSYCWKEFGAMTLFGQDVSHWAAITDPLGEP